MSEKPLATRSPSWVPRAHPLSWATIAVTTGAILMTAVDGGILPAVGICLLGLLPLARMTETVEVAR